MSLGAGFEPGEGWFNLSRLGIAFASTLRSLNASSAGLQLLRG